MTTIVYVPPENFEISTHELKARCSASELEGCTNCFLGCSTLCASCPTFVYASGAVRTTHYCVATAFVFAGTHELLLSRFLFTASP